MILNLFAFAAQNARAEFRPPTAARAFSHVAQTIPSPSNGGASTGSSEGTVNTGGGPRDCCADFAYVIVCDGETDTFECPFCGYTWTAPCR